MKNNTPQGKPSNCYKKKKKKRSGNLLIEVDNKEYDENLIQMKTFHNLKRKNLTLKRELSETELSLAIPEKKQPL